MRTKEREQKHTILWLVETQGRNSQSDEITLNLENKVH